MPDRKEINKRGYLKEDFRLFHLKDSRAQKVDYHYHAFDKLILLLGERSPMWWRTRTRIIRSGAAGAGGGQLRLSGP